MAFGNHRMVKTRFSIPQWPTYLDSAKVKTYTNEEAVGGYIPQLFMEFIGQPTPAEEEKLRAAYEQWLGPKVIEALTILGKESARRDEDSSYPWRRKKASGAPSRKDLKWVRFGKPEILMTLSYDESDSLRIEGHMGLEDEYRQSQYIAGNGAFLAIKTTMTANDDEFEYVVPLEDSGFKVSLNEVFEVSPQRAKAARAIHQAYQNRQYLKEGLKWLSTNCKSSAALVRKIWPLSEEFMQGAPPTKTPKKQGEFDAAKEMFFSRFDRERLNTAAMQTKMLMCSSLRQKKDVFKYTDFVY